MSRLKPKPIEEVSAEVAADIADLVSSPVDAGAVSEAGWRIAKAFREDREQVVRFYRQQIAAVYRQVSSDERVCSCGKRIWLLPSGYYDSDAIPHPGVTCGLYTQGEKK